MFKTRSKIIQEVTDDYMCQHGKIKSFDEISAIEEELVGNIQDAFDAHNVICDKDKKWKVPDMLNAAQIAEVMARGFHIIKINLCDKANDDEYTLLALYVDEVVSQIIGDTKLIGTYTISENHLKQIANAFNFLLTSREIDEVLFSLKRKQTDIVPIRQRCNDKDLIAVGNGIFNYATKQLLPFSPEYVFLSKSPVAYDANANNVCIHNNDDNTDWDVESWMQSLAPNDPAISELLWEVAGATIRPNVRWNKSAWLYSERGNNGKGTYCEMLRQLCGDENCASIPLADFSKEFALEPLLHSTAIVVDENDVGTFIDKAGNLKSVITNDVIAINRKFKTPVAFQFKGFMVQCLNELPRIKDKSDSFFRRQLFIPMEACFTGCERKYIKTEYLHRKDVLEYILYRVLNMNYYVLSEPASCARTLQKYKEFNDPVRQFWEELREEFTWDLLPYAFLYDLYKSWFKRNSPSGTVQGKQSFISDLQNVVRSDAMWFVDANNNQIRVTKTNMSKPELLIAEYGLDEWKSSRYKGTDINKICEFDRALAKYRGLQRYAQFSSESDE